MGMDTLGVDSHAWNTFGQSIGLPVRWKEALILSGGTAVACLPSAASSVFAQRISVRIKSGVPLTGLLSADIAVIDGLPHPAISRHTRR
jgi:hypothetical protein